MFWGFQMDGQTAAAKFGAQKVFYHLILSYSNETSTYVIFIGGLLELPATNGAYYFPLSSSAFESWAVKSADALEKAELRGAF